jgi:hypothetical protein
MLARDSAMPNAGHSQTNSSGPDGLRPPGGPGDAGRGRLAGLGYLAERVKTERFGATGA